MLNNYLYRHKPYAHQLEALKRSWNKKYFAYFMEMGCVDGETEYYTRDGWKKISEYDGEEILVTDKFGKLHWETPEAYICKMTDKFIKIHSLSGHIDMMLTPDHRVPIAAYYTRDLWEGNHVKYMDNTAQQLYDRCQRNTIGLRRNTGFPTTVYTNVFLTNRGPEETIDELLARFKQRINLNTMENINEVQRSMLLNRLMYKNKYCYVDSYAQARLVHHWLTMAGHLADIFNLDGKYRVTRRNSSTLSGDPRLHIYCRKYGSEKKLEIVEGKAPAYCFRTSTSYCLFRRGHHIFITGNSGKSKVIIDNAGMLYKTGAIDSMFITAPKGCYANWAKKEIPQHMSLDVDYTIYMWDSDLSANGRKKFIDRVKQMPKNRLNIFVVNIESMVSSKAANEAAKIFFKNTAKTMGVIDESTCIKTPTSKRTRKLLQLSDKFHVRRIATGSPITNSPFDVYSQCQFLEKGCLGFASYGRFRDYYAEFKTIRLANGQHVRVPDRYINLEDLAKRLQGLSYRVQKKDCLDLPPKVYQTRYVDLSPEQRQLYNQLKRERFAEFEGTEITTAMAMTLMMRLHQITCGHYKSDDGAVHRIQSNPRMTELMNTLEEVSGKTIIFANFVDSIREISERIEKVYGKGSYACYYGDTSVADRSRAISNFEDTRSDVRFFIGNTQTAGKGITLVAAENVIYYSNDYSLEGRQQSEDRAHRPGQTKSVTYIDLVAKRTVDEKIVKSLLSKREITGKILLDELEGWFNL